MLLILEFRTSCCKFVQILQAVYVLHRVLFHYDIHYRCCYYMCGYTNRLQQSIAVSRAKPDTAPMTTPTTTAIIRPTNTDHNITDCRNGGNSPCTVTYADRRDATADLKSFWSLATPTTVLARFPYCQHTELNCQKLGYCSPRCFRENSNVFTAFSNRKCCKNVGILPKTSGAFLRPISTTIYQSLVDSRTVTPVSEGWQRSRTQRSQKMTK